MKVLELNKVTHIYNSKKTDGVSDLSFSLDQAEVLSILGPSGSGKSTTLKLINQEIKAQKGSVEGLDKKIILVKAISHELRQEKVFDILMRQLDYFDDDEKRENQIRSTLSLLNMTNEISSEYSALSDGQKQRLQIAEALVHTPDLLLFDEPFGQLDEALRFKLINELVNIFKEKKIAVIWVTHNTREALAFSDKVLLLNFGKLVQEAPPQELYQKPRNLFVANFLGIKNIFLTQAKLTQDQLEFKLFNKKINYKKPRNFELKEHGELMLIAHNTAFFLAEVGEFKGKLIQSYFYGDHQWIQLSCNDSKVWIKTSPSLVFQENQSLRFSLNPESVLIRNEF